MFLIGCYTKGAGGNGEGISLVPRDRITGALYGPPAVTATPAPSFLARHPRAPVLYAANEIEYGTVSVFRVDAAASLVDTWPSGGSQPCHLSVDAAGRHLFVANYGSGTVAVFQLGPDGVPMRQSDVVEHSGRGPHPEHQTGPHAHAVAPTDGGVLAVDLGLDAVVFYPVDPAKGTLGEPEVALRTMPGAGPRHLAGSTPVPGSRRRPGTCSEPRARPASFPGPDPHVWDQSGSGMSATLRELGARTVRNPPTL